MNTRPRHPMQRLIPPTTLRCESRVLVAITDQMRDTFAACPHVPLMRSALAGPKKQARKLGGDRVAHHDAMSPFTGADLRLGVSYGQDPDLIDVLGTDRRWHLSMSQHIGNTTAPAPLPELLGWVMTGWPSATKFVVFTIENGLAIHADIAAGTAEDAHAFWSDRTPGAGPSLRVG